MRRGHPGIGGWRNDNSRHYRPRTGGPPLFRHPPRNYASLETPRFPPPGPRPARGLLPFNNHQNQVNNHSAPEHHDRNKFRIDHRQTNQHRPERSHYQNQRSIFPLLERSRSNDSNHGHQYKDNNYYNNASRDPTYSNNMGDIDHRQQGNMPKTPDYRRHPMSPWANPAEQRQFYGDRNKYKHDNVEIDKIPLLEYAGHRPPASDHYGGNPSSSIDNSNSFSRSVDDTVDIVRKRLQNRHEPPPPGEAVDHHDEDLRMQSSMPHSFQNNQQEQPPKKRIQRQRHDKSAESNCDKMKSKIVQQLFRMDKDRIHKLMDNPSSSSKFEYAISSLITESQNSLNKHLRSVAEKSLCSSEEFIHNDNNTIYEDTFMKQMQHILDPQDTVLLEDIKPLVLAELSKVLQLNEYDQPFQVVDDQQTYPSVQEQQIYENYESVDPQSYGSGEPRNYEAKEPKHYDDFSQQAYFNPVNSPPVGYEDYVNSKIDHNQLEYDQPEPEKPKPLFERRVNRRNNDYGLDSSYSPIEKSNSIISLDTSTSREEFPSFASDRRHSRRSVDSKKSEDKNKEKDQAPIFEGTAQFSDEEDDPFAELDRQYHVAVDHNFIDTYAYSSPQQITHNSSQSSSRNRDLNNSIQMPIKDSNSIKQEIDSQLLNIAKSPLKLQPVATNTEIAKRSSNTPSIPIKKEVFSPAKEKSNTDNVDSNVRVKHECNTEPRNENNQSEKSQSLSTSLKAAISTSSRKRSIDQKPSHRKEKRKKSEPSQSEPNQQILNKNIIINVNDCATKDAEKSNETAKSIFNLFFSKNEINKEVPNKETKKVESVDKSYSDKYVKRKETQKKSKAKEGDQKKRQRSISTSHSTVSPKETQCSKTDSKTKLQSIDMFLEQPKKSSTKHQAHRNTALPPNTPIKPTEICKQSSIKINRKMSKRHVGTQVLCNTIVKETQTFESKCSTSRLCQTETKKMLSKSAQTDPVSFEKSVSKATDAFERMKEIDMEIQALLQEKFKLYSSLESNSSCPSTIQTLGMTVLNVPFNEVTENDDNHSENSLTEDAIVDDFTSIPVEELEQIALESIDNPETSHCDKKSRRQKISQEFANRTSTVSPTTKRSARKANKTPNISLIEKIITDDRPLEEIIVLDDLETTPVKTKKKSAKQTKKKVNKKVTTKPNKSILAAINEYNLQECYVVLQRIDVSKYLKDEFERDTFITINSESDAASIADLTEEHEDITVKPDIQLYHDSDIVEETVVENDIHFDMLDVSEDIVIGDICEVKSGDKEAVRTESAITEDIILDNSQSSIEPVQTEGGAGENICKMYDYSTDDNLRRDAVTVSGHADAVLAIECIENNFVAACLDGNVYYFSGDGQLLSTLRGSNLAVTCLTIVKEKYGTVVYTGSLDSRIRFFDLETGLEKGPECNVLSPIQTMDRAWDTIFVGTRTGFVLQFECKNNILIPVSTVKFSEQSILALRAMKEGPRKVLLVAARSENVTIRDSQTGLLLRSLEGPKMTVYTLLYEDGKVYCGTSSHLIHLFDYASGSHIGAHEGGKGAVCLRATGGLLFAGCYDGCVYIYREGESRPLAQLRGPSLMLLSLAVVGSKIIAGYKDRSLYIWKIPLSILQEMIL